ncbi:MAG: hypothetical protein P1Q69_09965 [Candidatus Thorarchaeota archaeon]|nr:hypothetical protein [Candidatus Thorarchaeota archaeon]
MNEKEENGSHKQPIYCGIHARYDGKQARWFAIMSFTAMIVGYVGLWGSSISYLGLSFDIGIFFGLDSFILTESMLMIPIHFIIAMLFFAGGLEWYVLCRHCPCYEHSGLEHGNEKRFYCLANWGSPKLFKYDPTPVSRFGQAVFLIWGIGFAFLFPVIYLFDRFEWLFVFVLVVGSFLMTLRHFHCSTCPNFGCPLNSVPKEKREEFLEKMKSGEIYG